ncbi:MAG: cytochrome c [Deltaproteobacteria bacterium]|nr:cytochrome c [Deltaproteobacteria bacterium]
MTKKLAEIVAFLCYLIVAVSGCSDEKNKTRSIQPQTQQTSIVASESKTSPTTSGKNETVSPSLAKEKGCLSCHQGIEVINEKMQPFLLSQAGGKSGFECAVCHEGIPDATTKLEAHKDIYPNPSSMWVLNEGKGCAKCHSDKNAIKSLMGKPQKQHPAGGSLMEVVSYATDPSGASGRNHVYRMERALMALETGKANKTLMSNGVIPKGKWKYANFDMDDPDGPVPSAGSPEYKEWIAKALKEKLIEVMNHTERIPNLEEGTKLWGDPAKAGFADMHRKQCGRCHVWGEGRDKRGDHRAGGCAACHILYTNDAFSESNDPTIPKDVAPHPMKHEITKQIPAQQCNHCHTRGKRIGTTFAGIVEHQYVGSGKTPPFDDHGEVQVPLYTKEYNHVREDVHGERGMQCADCHSSIDVHGDGNIYPVTFYQVEVGCADCHGTPQKYPWELPVGFGTPVETKTERGTYRSGENEYLITTRGNARTRWTKEENKAYLTNVSDGKKREIPLLKNKALESSWKTEQGHVAMEVVSQHMDKLECYACHSTWAPQCYGCHIKYDARKEGIDWPLSAEKHNALGKQVKTTAPGDIHTENVSYIRWENPLLAVNYKGKVAPAIPGCQVVWSFVDKNGVLKEVNKVYKTSDGYNAPTLAPLQPHANTAVARTCESCHTDPKAIGYGVGVSRSSSIIDGDKPHFGNMGFDINADILSSKKAKPQIPGIKDFPYAWDQLVTRSGRQTQNLPLLADRPLNEQERNKVEREGSCVACHQYYNTPTWESIRTNLRKGLHVADGRALTPEEHDKAVQTAVLALAAFVGEIKEPPKTTFVKETVESKKPTLGTESAIDGAALFQKNCTACHTIGKGKLVGPDLKGVTSKRSKEWLIQWIKSSQAMVKKGDKEAVALFNEYHIPMPDQNLSDEEINAIYRYVKTQ